MGASKHTGDALVVVAKAPVVNQVKTRLCPPLFPEQAAELYRCFLLDTLEKISAMEGVQVCLAFTPAEAFETFRVLLPFRPRLFPQRGEFLGERLVNIFTDLFQEGFRQVAVVDSDSPTVPVDYLRKAFALLEDVANDVVFGPCSDGGYYLVGTRRAHPDLFAGVSWSTDRVLSQSLIKAKALRLRVRLLPPWYDVDNGEDLRRLVDELSSSASDTTRGASRTRRFLAELGLCPP